MRVERMRRRSAAIRDVGSKNIRDWVERFSAKGPEGLIHGKAPGHRPILNDAHRAALARTIENGPMSAIHGVVRWLLIILMKVDAREVSSLDRHADAKLRIARHGLPQTLRAPAPSRAVGGGFGDF
jgi:hypothetical protein